MTLLFWFPWNDRIMGIWLICIYSYQIKKIYQKDKNIKKTTDGKSKIINSFNIRFTKQLYAIMQNVLEIKK